VIDEGAAHKYVRASTVPQTEKALLQMARVPDDMALCRQTLAMRIWSLHPMYLDSRGLVALWREALLAQAVLKGQTNGYLHHPQLFRFREQSSPLNVIAAYLKVVHAESVERGYRFSIEKIARSRWPARLTVTRGQLDFEWNHLMQKLRTRDPARYARLSTVTVPRPHPLFKVVCGEVAHWEKGNGAADHAHHSRGQ
jgi:hypothetical protein